ncbi:hypothetical protein ABZ725_51395 [Streptomyces sp. NPDC006872]|uniref:hypothetical protein n=1 Tax=Streptomyces sp. NPDC006872 TaxID=3155720 RepID=UPI0033F2AA41
MGAEMLMALSALAVAVVTAVGGVATTVVGRRQPRGQRRRDDFAAVTARLDKDIERLEKRVAEQETASGRDRERISAQDFALRYLAGWCRTLVGYMRQSQLEPPPPPQPVPEEVRTYLHDLNT